MEKPVYVFDTNIVSKLIQEQQSPLLERLHSASDSILVLCEPVLYEVERGLRFKRAEKQLERFEHEIIPLFTVVPVQLADWRVAALLWTTARTQGKQFSDIDLLIAAVALRLSGVIVTADNDFDTPPINRKLGVRKTD